MYKAKVNNVSQFDVDLLSDLNQLDILHLNSGNFHVIKGNKSFQVAVLKAEPETKTLILKVNGSQYTVTLQDKMDLLFEKLGIIKGKGLKINDLKAPMPGLVLDVKVGIGQQIQKGDPLLVLEAMKMENVLKAQGDGIIKSIEVKQGDAVEKGSVLIKFQ
ncbi:acetyl-CoA carboxylase biotin carboxyl carrier protein subunit [Sphingobacteriales bacterium UPWRP_1]|nr:acetyl-CoA carboxylase biotin carboxyl carrier protein subunit [Sphingobacteriales bacterium TSM_CSM]PSJ76051.1 acetyl-CoA carboxylase biotin carboxyl carrier protein subunit [Sphingobacteriales bacterium UPWRP_1]